MISCDSEENGKIWNRNKIFIITPIIFQALILKLDHFLCVMTQEVWQTWPLLEKELLYKMSLKKFKTQNWGIIRLFKYRTKVTNSENYSYRIEYNYYKFLKCKI